MNYTDLLTIAMPVYERKDFFKEALESALNQTVKCKVIVVDNCSSHNYFETICKEKGVTYHKNDKNIGLFPNFNLCFELSETEYVMTLQDDDVISPIYVESFFNTVKNYPDIDIYFTDFSRNYYITGEKLSHNHTFPFGYMQNGKKVIEYGILYKLGFPVIASAIRKNKFTGYYTKFHSSNDWLWLYENADKLTFYGDNQKLYEFREHEKQNTRNNQSNILFSRPYIYDQVLKEKVKGSKMEKKASARALAALIRFKSETRKEVINDFINTDSIYSKYVKAKIEKSWMVNVLFLLPRSFVYLLNKTYNKAQNFMLSKIKNKEKF